MNKINLRQHLNLGVSAEKQTIELFIRVSNRLNIVQKKYDPDLIITPDTIFIDADSGDITIDAFPTINRSENDTDTVNITNIRYISPEKTGRLPLAPDYRSDYYSLGCIFYEILTDAPPFTNMEPAEIIHAHIARQPLRPDKKNSAVSRVLSDIVMKLLEKDPDNRYQSAAGLIYDLSFCLDNADNPKISRAFIPGLRDISPIFRIPDKLYGRHKEIQRLMRLFSKVEKGLTRYLSITGPPGIGKSFFINEMRHLFTKKGGYFISGKFEQYSNDLPYSAIVQAFSELVRQLLTGSEDSLAEWKKKIVDAAGINGKLITDIIPELVHIIGLQKDIAAVPAQEAQNRFNYVFHNFIQVFADREHPLIIFIDDMQWADSASIRLIELFYSSRSLSSVFFITAHRDIEIEENAAALKLLDAVRKDKEQGSFIELEPAGREYIISLLEDTLHSEIDDDNDLTKLILEKTNGNPLYIKELLLQLHSNGDISAAESSDGSALWIYDIKRISAARIPDNLVDIITRRIGLLPVVIQETLKTASCIGREFSTELLAELLETATGNLASILNTCIKENLVFMQDHNYRFIHDKVQESLYQLLNDREIIQLHYKTGMFLLRRYADNDEYIIDIVNHLNQAISLIETEEEKNNLCRLNYRAGLKAKKSNAYNTAGNLFKTAIFLLGDGGWDHEFDLTLSLHEEAAEAAYLSTDFNEMERYADTVLKKTTNILHKIKVYQIKMNTGMALNRPLDVVITGLDVLKKLGLKLPAKPKRINVIINHVLTRLLLFGKSDSYIQNLPLMRDPYIIAIIQIIFSLGTATYQTNQYLLAIMVYKSIPLLIKYGNHNSSTFGYATYGLLNCSIGFINTGYRFGKLGIQLLDTMNDVKIESYSRTQYIVNTFIRHWVEHIRETIDPLTKASHIGLGVGDYEYTAFNINAVCLHSYIAGVNLSTLHMKIKASSIMITKMKQTSQLYGLYLCEQLVLNLIEITDNPCELNGKIYNEVIMVPVHINSGDCTSLNIYYFSKTMLCCLFNNYNKALECCRELLKNTNSIAGTIAIPVFYFYYSISLLASCNTGASKDKKILKTTLKNQKKLKKWARHAPMNHLHKYNLVEAETARVNGNHEKAVDLYDRAISGARENLYINEEALANELAAKYYLSRNNIEKAIEYMSSANRCYEEWGAVAKCRHLLEKYPELINENLLSKKNIDAGKTIYPDRSENDVISLSSLDLESIYSAAKTLSAEKGFEQAVKKLLKVICGSSGAQRAVLLFYDNNEIYQYGIIESANSIEEIENLIEDKYDIEYRIPDPGLFPETIVRFSRRTGETIILNDARSDDRFSKDPYVHKNRVRSAVCVPLFTMNNKEVLIYLENNHLSDLFDSRRMNILNTITSQLSAALENLMLREMMTKESPTKTQNKQSGQSIEEVLLQKYGLTLQEVRIALMLKTGISREELCDELTISHKTLKNHLYSIYSKTINIDEDDFSAKGRIDKLSRLILLLMNLENE